jgi:hypothetical protein
MYSPTLLFSLDPVKSIADHQDGYCSPGIKPSNPHRRHILQSQKALFFARVNGKGLAND